MRYYGVDEKFVKVCEGLYSGVETRDVMNGMKSRWFGVLGMASLCVHFYLIFIRLEWWRNCKEPSWG